MRTVFPTWKELYRQLLLRSMQRTNQEILSTLAAKRIDTVPMEPLGSNEYITSNLASNDKKKCLASSKDGTIRNNNVCSLIYALTEF